MPPCAASVWARRLQQLPILSARGFQLLNRIAVIALLALIILACSGPEPSPTMAPTPTSTPVPTGSADHRTNSISSTNPSTIGRNEGGQ